MEFEKAYLTLVTVDYADTMERGIKHITENEAIELYLDYVNNFLTIERFSEYYGISVHSANSLLKKVRYDNK